MKYGLSIPPFDDYAHPRKLAEMAREAVERYLAALADEIADGEWVDIPYIGKIQVVLEEGKDYVNAIMPDSTRVRRPVKTRLRTKLRLYETFKHRCRSTD